MPIRQQSTDPEDRPDIRFFSRGGADTFSSLATDIGQYETDLTVGGGNDVVYEPSPANRMNGVLPRTIALHLTAIGTGSTLYRHGSGASSDALVWSGSQYNVVIGGSVVVNLPDPPDNNEIIVVVRSEDNPGTTGASDAVLTTLEIYDVGDGSMYRAQGAHAAIPSPTEDFAFLADDSAGTSSFITAGGTCDKIRFSSRAVAFTEIAQDWIAALSDPTSDAKLVRQGVPLTEASGVGDVAELHGPAVQWAAAELRHAQWRQMGALANWRFINTYALTESSHDVASFRAKMRLAPSATDYRLFLGWFGVWPVAPMANALWVEVHARAWNVTDADLHPSGLRVYSFNRNPADAQQTPQNPGDGSDALEYRYAEATFSLDEAAPGTWKIQAKVPVVRGESGLAAGKTYLGIAYALDLNEDADALQIEVNAFHAVQIYDTTVGAPPGGGPAGEAG